VVSSFKGGDPDGFKCVYMNRERGEGTHIPAK